MKDDLDETKLRFSTVLGITTRHYEAGQGEPIVLLHGGHIGFVDSLDSWSLNLEALQRRFKVLALDKLGQGHTAPPCDDMDFTQTHTLKHTLAWLDALGVTSAHLVGHSRGGLLAAQIALSRPDLVASIAIVDSATLAPDPQDPSLNAGTFYERVGAYAYASDWTESSVVHEPTENSFGRRHLTSGHVRRRLAFARSATFGSGAQRMHSGLATSVFGPDLHRARGKTLETIANRGLPARTLIVWGAEDPSAPLAEVALPLMRCVAARTPSVEMHVFGHAGHYPFREHPQAFSQVIANHALGSAGDEL